MSTVTRLRELGDPNALWWDYADLAEVFGLSIDILRRKLRLWEDKGFPAPLPYHGTKKRWRPAAVQAWMARTETAAGARAPVLTVIEGGRS